jgi:hypothetical protein
LEGQFDCAAVQNVITSFTKAGLHLCRNPLPALHHAGGR